MKRISGLYEQIIALDNLRLADENARKGKLKSFAVKKHDKNCDENIFLLHKNLREKKFKTSAYHKFYIHEPKKREIYRLPYYPDRIVHHAILNVLEPIWMKVFTKDTYSCIKERGIHGAANQLKQALKDTENTQYCLKTDIKKFYPSINHEILKQIIRRKIKDTDLLYLLDEIVDSAKGVPIGNYTSQYFANLYLAYFDHWIKEELKVKYYFRYADDMIFLGADKQYLHSILQQIKEYLDTELKLELKGNYQVFPVHVRGIDFVGYRFYHTHVLLRKSIKKRFARAVAKKGTSVQTHAAYWGWTKHCNSKNLLKKLNMKKFSDLNVPPPEGSFSGEKIKIDKVLNRPVIILASRIAESKYKKNKSGKVLMLQLEINDEKRVLFTGSDVLISQIEHVKEKDYPFETTIVKENEHFQFT